MEEWEKIGGEGEEVVVWIGEIESVGGKRGGGEVDEDGVGVNVWEIEGGFEVKDGWDGEVLEEVGEKLWVIRGGKIEMGEGMRDGIDGMLRGREGRIGMKVLGDEVKGMFGMGKEIKEGVRDVEGIGEVNVEEEIEGGEVKIVGKGEMVGK